VSKTGSVLHFSNNVTWLDWWCSTRFKPKNITWTF